MNIQVNIANCCLQLNEMMFAAIDALMARGEIEEFGFFSDGRSEYVIGKGETIDSFRNVSMFLPYVYSGYTRSSHTRRARKP